MRRLQTTNMRENPEVESRR